MTRLLITVDYYGIGGSRIASIPQIIGVLYLISTIVTLVVGYIAWKYRAKLGAIPLFLLNIGIFGWTALYGLGLLIPNEDLTIAFANIEIFFSELVGIAWFILALEYTRQEKWTNRKFLPLFFIMSIVTVILAFTNSSHYLVRTPETYVNSQGVLQPDFAIWYWIHIAYTFFFVFGGTALLVNEFIRSQGVYRRQIGALIAAWSIPFTANVAFNFGIFNLDVTPAGFLVTETIILWALISYQLLEVVPIARRQAMEELDDAVVTLNKRGEVIDINQSAKNLLDIDSRVIGKRGDELFSEYPEMVDEYGDVVDTETEIKVEVDGERKYLDLKISPLEDSSGELVGRLIVLSEITEVKEREKELDLLKQVMSRLLRHNIRNELNVARAYAEMIAEEDGDHSQKAEKIVEKTDQVIYMSQKARLIENVLEKKESGTEIEVTEMIESSVEKVRDEYPDTEYELELPDEIWVWGDEALESAILNLVENAVVHNNSDKPWVKVSVSESDDWVEVSIKDNGPGIPQEEIDVLEKQEETQLKHGSGMGLWLIDWIIDKSDGELKFEEIENGTEVVVRLKKTENVN